jgi:2'-phosphotransferase
MAKVKDSDISKVLSYKLRHDITVKRDDEGYVNVKELGINVSLETIQRIVANNNKSRFNLIECENEWFIRANQGHSKDVGAQLDDMKVMTQLIEPIEGVFHGTYRRFLDQINEKGLNRMSRKHIHFAKSVDAKSGKRNDCDAIIYIDMAKAMKDGIVFYESDNGVILSEGIDGIIPNNYFIKIDLV